MKIVQFGHRDERHRKHNGSDPLRWAPINRKGHHVGRARRKRKEIFRDAIGWSVVHEHPVTVDEIKNGDPRAMEAKILSLPAVSRVRGASDAVFSER